MLAEAIPVDIGHTLTIVDQWLREYVCEPDPRVGRRGAVCPFVEPSMRADALAVRVRLLGPTPSAALVTESVHCALDEFEELEWRRSNPTLRSLVVVIADLPDDRLALLDEAHQQVKSESVRRGLMIGQFHARCEEPAARNPSFMVSQSPVPMLAVRAMALHDVFFLRARRDWFQEYMGRFAARYRGQRSGIDPMFAELFDKARSMYGLDDE